MLTSCASPFGGGPMQGRIEGDLAMFNATYADAVNNQMLWNILRARDRLPTQYAGINAISAIQKRSIASKLDLNAVNLGTKFAKGVWGVGTGELSGSAEADPQYGVTPLGGANFTKAVLSPTPAEVFDHYWRNGWPKDLLLAVLVKDANKLSDDPHEDLAADCVRTTGMTTLSNKIDNTGDKSDAPFLVWSRTVKTYSGALQTRVTPIRICEDHAKGDARNNGKSPEHSKMNALVLAIEPGDKTAAGDVGLWELDLRSLDEVVFYLGEIIRDEAPAEEQTRGVAYGPDLVTAADCHNGAAADAPLFRVTRKPHSLFRFGGGNGGSVAGPNRTTVYAAETPYGGYVYAAGPAAPLHAACRGPGVVDRTANVLDLLTQVLQANLDPDSLRSSLRFIAN
jgi:hypothetical protein